MKKFLYFLPCLFFIFLFFFNFCNFSYAATSNLYSYAVGEGNFTNFKVGTNAGGYETTFTNDGGVNGYISYNCSSPLYVLNGFVGPSSSSSTMSCVFLVSANNFTFTRQNSGSIGTYTPTRLSNGLYSYCVSYNGINNSPVVGYWFGRSSSTPYPTYSPYNDDNPLLNDLLDSILNGTYVDPSIPGALPSNPISNGAIGNLVDLQNTFITYDNAYSELFSSEIPVNSHINFKWGDTTNNGYKLTDYSIQYFATGTILRDKGANGIDEYTVKYSDGNNNFNKSFYNEWGFVIDWSDILDACNIPNTTNIDDVLNIGSSTPLAQSYFTNSLKFSFRPVLKINDKYYAGQWTQVDIKNNGLTGSISTENVIIDSEGTRPSTNQNGTGVNNNPNNGNNPYDDFINGSSSNYDFSGFIDTTNSVLAQVQVVPRIFGLIFSWLPSWVTDMFAMAIGFLILGILISIIIKVVT